MIQNPQSKQPHRISFLHSKLDLGRSNKDTQVQEIFIIYLIGVQLFIRQRVHTMWAKNQKRKMKVIHDYFAGY